jgi:hypothetical protein
MGDLSYHVVVKTIVIMDTGGRIAMSHNFFADGGVVAPQEVSKGPGFGVGVDVVVAHDVCGQGGFDVDWESFVFSGRCGRVGF